MLRTLIFATIAVCALGADAKWNTDAMKAIMAKTTVGNGPETHCAMDPAYQVCYGDFNTQMNNCMQTMDCNCLGDAMRSTQGCFNAIGCYTTFEKEEWCEVIASSFELYCPTQLPVC